MSAPEGGVEHEANASSDDADVVTHSEAHGTPRRRRKLNLRLPREARVGIAVSLSFGLLATVMVVNRPLKDKGASRTPPNMKIAGSEGSDDPKGSDGAKPKNPESSGNNDEEGRSPDKPTGVAANSSKEGGSQTTPALPPSAVEPKPRAETEKHVDAKPVDTPALPPSGEGAAPPKPVEVIPLPVAGENAAPPKPVEEPSVAEAPKPAATEPGDGPGAPAPVANASPLEARESEQSSSAPLPALPATSSTEPASTPNAPEAVPLPPPANTGSDILAPPSSDNTGSPNLPAPGAAEPAPAAVPLPVESGSPNVAPMPTGTEPTADSSTAKPTIAPSTEGASQSAPLVTESAPKPAPVDIPAAAASPDSRAPSAVPPVAAAAPTESAVMPSSASSADATGGEPWVKLQNTRFHHDADDRAATPITRAEPNSNSASSRVRPEVTDKIEPIPHVVQPDENFWTISRLYYRSGRYYKALWAANRDRVPDITKLYVGTTIRIPPHEALDPALIQSPSPKAAEVSTASSVPLERTSRPVVTEGSRPAKSVKLLDDEEKSKLPVRGLVRETTPSGRSHDDVEDEEPEPEVDRPRRPRYRVRTRYETIRSIAKATLGDAHREDEILKLNKKVIKDPYHLTPGQYLELPEDALTGGTTR